MTYTVNIYYIIFQHKEKLHIYDSYSAQRNLFLKHIPHIAYTLQIYDIIVQHKEKFV